MDEIFTGTPFLEISLYVKSVQNTHTHKKLKKKKLQPILYVLSDKQKNYFNMLKLAKKVTKHQEREPQQIYIYIYIILKMRNFWAEEICFQNSSSHFF